VIQDSRVRTVSNVCAPVIVVSPMDVVNVMVRLAHVNVPKDGMESTVVTRCVMTAAMETANVWMMYACAILDSKAHTVRPPSVVTIVRSLKVRVSVWMESVCVSPASMEWNVSTPTVLSFPLHSLSLVPTRMHC